MDRDQLVSELNEELEKLRHSGKKDLDTGVFLHQSINLHADEATLVKILKDVRKFKQKWSVS